MHGMDALGRSVDAVGGWTIPVGTAPLRNAVRRVGEG